MPRPVLRPVALAVVAIVVALALAACGGGDDGGGEDRTQGLTPAQLVQRSAVAWDGVETFRIALEATGRVETTGAAGAGGPGGLSRLLAGELDVSGEGPVQMPDRASLDVRIDLGGPALQGNLTRVGDEVFVGLLGQDFRADLPPEQVGLLDLGDLYPVLAGWIERPRETGREEVDGTDTVKLTGQADAARVLRDMGPLLGGRAITPAQARAALEEATVELWIGTGDLLPRRLHLVLRGDASRVSDAVGALDVDLTARMSAYGEPVDIQAPRDARPLDLDRLGALGGG
ncbi:hypothetical protein [Miltoncostaea marina]|uniref:hypothetical protein n=1 Tax=Miltoncostaea marina TaxID=2843215 RepID=UPI001C3D1216|nr:hypothetical protein [Miltoncostaea marina]